MESNRWRPWGLSGGVESVISYSIERFGGIGNVDQVTRPVRLEYFALLREQRGLGSETVETAAATARELYRELAAAHGFTLPAERVRVAVNNAFAPWDRVLTAGDIVVFIPPVAGG